MTSPYYLRNGTIPYLDGVKQRYELIEKKIKDFHEKSRFTGISEINGQCYTNSSNSKIHIKDNEDNGNNWKTPKDLKEEYEIKIEQLTKEYEKNMALLGQEYEQKAMKLQKINEFKANKKNYIDDKRFSLTTKINQPKDVLFTSSLDLDVDRMQSNLRNSNQILQEMKENLSKDPHEYRAYVRQENLRSKINNLKKELEITKKKSINHKNPRESLDKRKSLITTEDDEENEEFLAKYRLFKEKYLLKESLKPTNRRKSSLKNASKK